MLTLVNGKDSQALGDIEMAGPGYFLRTTVASWLADHRVQREPPTHRRSFNVGEKRGVAQVDFAPVAGKSIRS